jgi:hypothetical protein
MIRIRAVQSKGEGAGFSCPKCQFIRNDLTNHSAGIVLDEFIIMPNHVHGIIKITGLGLD